MSSQWRNPATPSRAAAADAAVKLVGANILPADSDVTYDMLDLSDRQRQTLRMEQRRKQAREYIQTMSGGTNVSRASESGREEREGPGTED